MEIKEHLTTGRTAILLTAEKFQKLYLFLNLEKPRIYYMFQVVWLVARLTKSGLATEMKCIVLTMHSKRQVREMNH